MIIGLDFDGVIGDFNTPFLELIHNKYPHTINMVQNDYNYSTCFNIPVKEMGNIMKNLPIKFYWDMKPYEADYSFLKGHIVYIITSRILPEGIERQDMITLISEWLSINTNITPMGIVNTEEWAKVDVADNIGVDIYVDDKYEVLRRFINREAINAYLIGRKYNGEKQDELLSNLIKEATRG